MKSSKIISITALLLLSGCVSNIHTEIRPIENPGSIESGRTYHWVASDLSLMAPREMPSSTFTAAIKDEIDKSLARLGYEKVPAGQGEFTVDTALTLLREESQRIETKALYDQEDYLQYGLRWRFGSRENIFRPDAAQPHVEISVYERGTLHIGAFDSTGNIAWHGEAHKIIEMRHAPNEHENVLREATRKLMLHFPKAIPP